MGTLGTVDLDFGMKGFDSIQKAFTWMENMGKKVQKVVGGIEKPFENVQATFDSTIERMKTINKQFDGFRDDLSKTQNVFSGLGDNKLISYFSDLNDKILQFGQTAALMQEMGGITGLFRMQVMQLQSTLTMAFGAGMQTQVLGLLSVFSSLLPWVVAIGAAVGLIFKIWENNIGNIRGLWISFTGRIQKAWAQFDLQLRKALINLTPIFNAVFKPIFAFLGSFIEGALKMFTELLWVFSTVGKVLGPVIGFFARLFGIGNKVSNMFGGLGKIIGRFVAIALTIMLIVKVVNAVIAVISILKVVWLALNAAFLASPIGWIILIIVAIIAVIVLLVKHFDKVRAFFAKMAGFIVDGFKKLVGWFKKAPIWLLLLMGPIGMIIIAITKGKKIFDALGKAAKFVGSIIAKVFKEMLNNAKKPFELIWSFIKKVFEAWKTVKSFFTGGKKEIDVEANVKPSGGGSTNNNTTNTNVTVHTSGSMNETSANRIGEGLANGVNRNRVTN